MITTEGRFDLTIITPWDPVETECRLVIHALDAGNKASFYFFAAF